MIRQVTCFCACALCAVMGMMGAAPQKKQVLSGQVLDSSDNPIKDVRVRLTRGSEPMIESKSGTDGTYTLSFQSGKPIDTVEYELTGWDRAVISALSGGRDHSVNKTLYPAGSSAAQVKQLDAGIMDTVAKGDTDLFAKATTADYIAATPEGRVLSKDSILEAYRSGPLKAKKLERSEIEVRVHGDAAVILGLARVTSAEKGERQVRAYRFMRAYAREQGGWKLIASQQMQIPDRAFGAALGAPPAPW